jgi:hypothetical protein
LALGIGQPTGHDCTDGSDLVFIWRFDVLLAVDVPAHANASALPMAPAHEIAQVEG